MTQDPILRDMLARRDVLDHHFAAYQSPSWIRQALRAEIDALQRLEAQGDWLHLRNAYLQLMAITYRALRDLQLETAAAAAEKDIPF